MREAPLSATYLAELEYVRSRIAEYCRIARVTEGGGGFVYGVSSLGAVEIYKGEGDNVWVEFWSGEDDRPPFMDSEFGSYEEAIREAIDWLCWGATEALRRSRIDEE